MKGNLPPSPRGAFLLVPLVIASCTVLHICVGVGDVLSPADDERVEEEEGEEEREEIQGAFSGNTMRCVSLSAASLQPLCRSVGSSRAVT
jgi:hypothetical protein